jgi:hypothetical protein
MNRNLSKAIAVTVAALAGTQAALAQYDPQCWPPMSTTGPSTSPPLILLELTTQLFVCAFGQQGTDTYAEPDCGNETMTAGGRFGFAVGSTGSIQSTIDDALSLTFGMPTTTGNSCGFAMIVTGTAPNYTKTVFGPPTLSDYGASNRYFYLGSTVSNFNCEVHVDVIGDAARFTWTLQNPITATAAAPVGLMVGSWVQPATSEPFDHDLTYVYTPGYKPFIVEEAWIGTAPNPALPFPQAMSFAISQSNYYGLQVINSPLTAPNVFGINAPDQTQVNDFVIGQGYDVLNHDAGELASTTPAPPYPYIIYDDEPFIEVPEGIAGGRDGIYYDDAAFLQFWYPILVAPNTSRTIISYYRTPWGVSDYQNPFTAVVDTPLAITTNASNPGTFANGTFDFRVYVDNVGGYDYAGKSIPLTSTRIQVNLPQGMVDATNPTGANAGTLISYIPTIASGSIGIQDFSVQVNTTTAPGPQTYTVQITSPTGANKTLYGTINVAGTPNLTILQAANLVGVPWNFTTADWGTILGLTPNTDFQAFSWNAPLGQYVLQPNAVRGQGVFIVSQTDHGTISLGGSPTQSSDTLPTDIVTGQTSQTSIELNPGWNLISNPFNYVISLGQLLGVDTTNPNTTLTFTDMVSASLISASFAYYDPQSQGYNYISQISDLLVPNQGYWVFVQTTDNLNLVFPTVLSPSVRAVAAPWKQTESQWRLQLVAENGKNADSQNFVGVAPVAVSKLMTTRKPPMAPVANAVSLAVQDSVNGKVVPLAQSLRTAGGNTQSWNVQVTSKAAGPVTINWPNLSTVPTDVQFQLTDVSSGATRDIRRGSGYTFNATAGSTRSFTIAAVPGAASRAIISNISATNIRGGGGVTVSYVLASSATVSVRILQTGRVIYQAVSGRSVTAGTNTATWALRDSANRLVAPGTYQIEVIAEGADGSRVNRTIPIVITR